MTKKWLEILDENGSIQFLDPESIIRITLLGNKQAVHGVVVVTTQGDVTTRDTDGVAMLRELAFSKAGLGKDGNFQPVPRLPSPTR